MKRIIISLAVVLWILSSCKNDQDVTITVLKQLYETYANGEISECLYNGEVAYIAGINAYDAGSLVYDIEGNIIGTCNYAWGQVDAICSQLTHCEAIYRCKNHISGRPPIDKYGLSN